jgi:hypothetical protein
MPFNFTSFKWHVQLCYLTEWTLKKSCSLNVKGWNETGYRRETTNIIWAEHCRQRIHINWRSVFHERSNTYNLNNIDWMINLFIYIFILVCLTTFFNCPVGFKFKSGCGSCNNVTWKNWPWPISWHCPSNNVERLSNINTNFCGAEKFLTQCLCPLQIPHGVTWERTRASAVRFAF